MLSRARVPRWKGSRSRSSDGDAGSPGRSVGVRGEFWQAKEGEDDVGKDEVALW